VRALIEKWPDPEPIRKHLATMTPQDAKKARSVLAVFWRARERSGALVKESSSAPVE
jgi:hypothetical protein